jgi:DNA-binding protein HU-beta
MNPLIKMMIDRYPFLTEGTAGGAYDGLIESLQELFATGKSVTLPGLGRFKVRLSKARQGYNIKTKERVTIPAKPRVKFTLDPKVEVGVPQ